jgi:hypothetical protein
VAFKRPSCLPSPDAAGYRKQTKAKQSDSKRNRNLEFPVPSLDGGLGGFPRQPADVKTLPEDLPVHAPAAGAAGDVIVSS